MPLFSGAGFFLTDSGAAALRRVGDLGAWVGAIFLSLRGTQGWAQRGLAREEVGATYLLDALPFFGVQG